MAEKKKVVIVGGGFGGLEAAKALAGAPVEVLLVDRANYHLFQPLLYQVAMAGLAPSEIASPIRGILAHQANVRVVLGEVTKVDLANEQVHLDGAVESYDWLVVAVGAETSYFGHDEWEPAAPSLKSLEDALEIRRRVLTTFEKAERCSDPVERKKLLTFVVIGGGPTGVELAGAVAELSRFALSRDFRHADPREAKVILVEAGPRILSSFAESLGQSAIEQLGELGVEVRTGDRVVAIDDDGVKLEGKDGEQRIEARTVVWGAGVQASGLTRGLGVEIDRAGRILVAPDCSIPGHPNAFAIGDAAHFEEKGQLLPGVSPVAMQQARFVAKIIDAEGHPHGTEKKRPPFSYFDKGSMATIGRSRAIAQVGKLKLHGFLAWLAWLFIHLLYLIGFRNRIVVLFDWAWSYLSYKRGSRLITSTGWRPSKVRHATVPITDAKPAPSPLVAPRAPASDRRSASAPTPTS